MKTDKHKRRMPDNPIADLPARRFWSNIDREQLELALSSVPDKYDAFLNALHDPTLMRASTPTLMRKFNISLHELQLLYTDHMRQLGLLKMSSDLPQVMSDVADDAKNKLILCPRCEGTKVVESTKGKKKIQRTCPSCEGVGRVLAQGDKHARDLMFESMKLTKLGGPLVAIQQNFGDNSNLDSKMESQLKLTQSIIMGDRKEEQPA